MSYSLVSPLYRVCLCAVITYLSAASSAQTQITETTASCTFKLFQLNPTDAANPMIYPVNGVNDWGTVVGEAIPGQQPRYSEAFARYSGGTVSYYSPPNAIRTQFNSRNNNGVTVGYYQDAAGNDYGFMLQGSTVTSINDPQGISSYGQHTRPVGINRWNSIVGQYVDKNAIWRGFKRYSNGSFIDLNYPGAQSTYPSSINDSGVVVGMYVDFNYNPHGFIYRSGQWATLDYFDSATGLDGITNAGVILVKGPGNTCNPLGCGLSGWFLYMNGTFKALPEVPNSTVTEFGGISPDGGLLTGRTNVTGGATGWRGFTATCK